MLSTFTPNEITVLKETYRLTFKTSASDLTTQVSLLLDEEKLHTYLTKVKSITKAANLGVAASLFVKRYSFAVLIALYSMTIMNKRIDFSVDNLSIQTLDESDTIWLPSIKFESLNLSPSLDFDRANWRNEILTEIFSNHIEILFSCLNKVSKLSKRIMWENLYTYIVWMYTNLLANKEYEDLHPIIIDDFDWITSVGKGNVFGEYIENPFLNFRGTKESINLLDGTPHKRITCCLSYLTESNRSFCKNCPIKRKRKQV
ncbi:IucA/IucC family C-terminal-domain containing protein [Ureibacillus acetophenoni]|uniref:Ferric iron reductase protein FhuF n=1 Tax=Ureibacillus acetophenoni TaxID=614649 RepID=A0A285UCZ1_9BACL|nr:IucA/IucC family C-terminal-domain containing protein [Ureibacillus acetophenoni]SOC39775.1 ferric iron reductase protein FhuF [Ureibacillus acetophenoni]